MINYLDKSHLGVRFMYCHNCGSEISVNDNFCKKCGVKNVIINTKHKKDTDIVAEQCTVCGEYNPIDVNYCIKCGYYLLSTIAKPKQITKKEYDMSKKSNPLNKKSKNIILYLIYSIFIIGFFLSSFNGKMTLAFLFGLFGLSNIIKPFRFLGIPKRMTGLYIFLIGLFVLIGTAGFYGNTRTTVSSVNKSNTNTIINKDDYIKSCKKYKYEDISRYPDNYKGKNAVFTGQVIQVAESGNNVMLRVNVTKGDYNIWKDTIYVDYKKQKSNESRILENDIINVYGQLNGIKSYTSILKTNVQIPWLICKYIDIAKQ